jgi:spermidine synthase
VLRVTNDDDKPLRRLFHGTTIHGIQFTIPERRCEPLSYYHAQGPVSEIAKLFRATPLPRAVGLVGLGAGAMITYSRPDEKWMLYEIDPAVIRIASDTNYFTYLSDCARAPYSVQLGDARLRLRQAGDRQFGILYLDAFSSDVIPMHLLTREAFQLYSRKLAPNGILALHLSSRHFELEPLVANLGATLNLLCFTSTEGDLSPAALAEGGLESDWVILVSEATVPKVAAANTWRRVLPDKNAPLWTDDFSSLIGVLKLD